MRLLVAAVFTAALVAACGSTETETSSETEASSETETGASSETETETPSDSTAGSLIVLPDADGQLPPDVIVGCPSGPWFPASALYAGAPLVEDSEVPEVLDAIGPFLDNEEGAFWPQEGWRLLHADDRQANVVHLGESDGSGLAFMTAEFRDGAWVWAGASGGGECPIVVQSAGKLNTVEWELDPTVEEPTADTTTITLIANERECVSGQPMGDRLLPPEVVFTADAVLVALAATPPDGDSFDCPGNPSQQVVIELDEPLGSREVRNGLSNFGDLIDYIG